MTSICAIAAALAVFLPAGALAAGWSHILSITCQASGFIASTLVLTTFIMKDMRTLRVVAIFSNIAFITYAAFAWLPPVLILHVTLLPLNLLRLHQITKTESGFDLDAIKSRIVSVGGNLLSMTRVWLEQGKAIAIGVTASLRSRGIALTAQLAVIGRDVDLVLAAYCGLVAAAAIACSLPVLNL